MAEQFLNLQHSESVIAQMSATIFASLVQSKGLTEANEDQLSARAVVIAISLLALDLLARHSKDELAPDGSCLADLWIRTEYSRAKTDSAHPTQVVWKHLSSARGELPVPGESTQQTGAIVADLEAP